MAKAPANAKKSDRLSTEDSEIRYRRLFESAQDGILILDAETGMIDDVNPFLTNLLGYTREEFTNKRLWEVGAFGDIEANKDAFVSLQENDYIRYEDLPLKTKDGRLISVEFVSNAYVAGSERVIQCNIRDITARKYAEGQVLQQAGLLENVNDAIVATDALYKIKLWNKGAESLYGWTAEEVLELDFMELVGPERPSEQAEDMQRVLAETGYWAGEGTHLGKDGARFPVEISYSVLRDEGGEIAGHVSVNRDLRPRKQSEESLRLQSAALNAAANTIVITNPAGEIEWVNPAFTRLTGFTIKEALGKNPRELVRSGEQDRAFYRELWETILAGEVWSGELINRRKDGSLYTEHQTITPLVDADGKISHFIAIKADISERKRAEETLRDSTLFTEEIVNSLPARIFWKDVNLGYMGCNTEFAIHAGFAEPSDLVGKNDYQMAWRDQAERYREADRQVIASGLPKLNYEEPLTTPQGDNITILTSKVPLYNSKGQIIGVLGSYTDISDRVRAREMIQRQFEHLSALRRIDRVISSSFDLDFSLTEILTQVTNELNVDASDILLLTPGLTFMECAIDIGFRSSSAHDRKVFLSDSYAGRAALERRLVQIPNLSEDVDNPLLAKTFAGEGFRCYYGLPLIAKGKVMGVLEVFDRNPLNPDQEWLDFFESLAGQAAIAVENSKLFQGLERSNLELVQAYDATIEGWSRALDLRDKETEGHTLRVTEMTGELSHAFGLNSVELANARWGALLHDIGKMGVPDQILLKPGPLTDDEWVKMKKHPTLALELLSPIHYLRLALDIPYCHHEKWDGSGYPRGLKGKQIPLVARIFAVIDVWDALTADRPYRPAWTAEKARQHILDSSGTAFDPEVVEMFMRTFK
jgi:PAS domain S-box-containing protein/putative nucleotidyltransferase with HDIG domain